MNDPVNGHRNPTDGYWRWGDLPDRFHRVVRVLMMMETRGMFADMAFPTIQDAIDCNDTPPRSGMRFSARGK